MIDLNQLPDIISGYVEALKAARDGDVKYTERYNYSVEQAEEIEVHSDGEFPSRLIQGRAPSETEKEFEYRKHAYEPVTRAPWAQLNNALESVWHGVEVTTEDEDFAKYIGEGYPNYSGLVEWFKEVAGPKKTEDPNAVVYVTLKAEPQSDAELVEPIAVLLPSVDVVDFKDEYFLGVTRRDVPIKYGNRVETTGIEFVIIDDEYEYRYTQVGKKTDWTFDLTYEYRHGLGRIPAYQLKGIPKKKQGGRAWESLFYNAVPYLNKAAVESSTLDALIIKHGFPTRVYYEEDCDEMGCENGYLTEDGQRSACQTCGGTGKKRGFTWGADYTHRPPGRLESDVQPDFPGMTYVSPPVEPMEFLDKRIDGLIEKASHAVNFDLTRKSSAPVTATEKGIDLQEQYKILLKFSSSLYDMLDYVLWDVARLRYPLKEIEYTLHRRSEFSIRSAEQLIAEYEQYAGSGLPQFAGAEVIQSFVKNRFNGDGRMGRVLEVLEYVDGLHGYTPDQAGLIISRSGQPWQGVLHFQANSLIRQAQNDNPDFLAQDLSAIKAELERRAREVASAGGTAQTIIEGLA